MTRILIVDDDPFLCTMVAEYFSNHGYDVTTAVDGTQGGARVLKNVPDLILTDINMPGNEGGRFILQLRESWPEVPVVVMSGGDDDAFEPFVRLGCHRLSKPFVLSRLKAVVECALDASTHSKAGG